MEFKEILDELGISESEFKRIDEEEKRKPTKETFSFPPLKWKCQAIKRELWRRISRGAKLPKFKVDCWLGQLVFYGELTEKQKEVVKKIIRDARPRRKEKNEIDEKLLKILEEVQDEIY